MWIFPTFPHRLENLFSLLSENEITKFDLLAKTISIKNAEISTTGNKTRNRNFKFIRNFFFFRFFAKQPWIQMWLPRLKNEICEPFEYSYFTLGTYLAKFENFFLFQVLFIGVFVTYSLFHLARISVLN